MDNTKLGEGNNIPDNEKSESSISPIINSRPPNLSTGKIESFAGPQEEISLSKQMSQTPPSSSIPVKKEEEESSSSLNTDAKKKRGGKQQLKKSFSIPKIKFELSRKVLLIFLGVVIFSAIVFMALYFYITNLRSVPLTIVSNQESVELMVDENKYGNISSPHIIKLKPGIYTIVVSKTDFFSQEKIIEVGGTEGTQELVFDLVEKQPISQILNKEILYPTYNEEDGLFLFFVKEEGNAYSLHEYSVETKEEIVLTDKAIFDLENVIWSPSAKQVIIKVVNQYERIEDGLFPFIEKYGSGAKINWVLNLERKDLVNITAKYLDAAIKNISFSPNGDKIVYFFKNDLERSLAVANNDGSEFERIIQLKNLTFDPELVWSPDGNKVAIFIESDKEKTEKHDVYLYSFSERNIKRLTDNGKSLGAVFSPDGDKIIYKSSNSVWLYDLKKEDEEAAMNLETSAQLENCVWLDNQNLAVADKEGVVWKINTTGEKNILNYKENMAPENISNVLIGKNNIFLVNEKGIYELGSENGL